METHFLGQIRLEKKRKFKLNNILNPEHKMNSFFYFLPDDISQMLFFPLLSKYCLLKTKRFRQRSVYLKLTKFQNEIMNNFSKQINDELNRFYTNKRNDLIWIDYLCICPSFYLATRLVYLVPLVVNMLKLELRVPLIINYVK